MNTQNCVTNKPIRCTTHFHACDCREYEFEQLRKENKELEYYKEQWQSIAGKANLKNLVATAEKLEKENEELKRTVAKINDDFWFMINLIERYSTDKDETLKDVLGRMKFRKPMIEKWLKGEKK